ncbi:DUF488 domain-containing protein [Saliterribacillus persicus]|uniref:Uncharacterized protein YeaO (DUF488 family) n=1 Tax=Saliterribacillus persicus TaxID=930114 RepID=A0A368XVB6_9BACI|nr:uncharacterized protein YeaO (DUF488 family) [Saliterribacillus persicus]
MIKLKRVYEDVDKNDGLRILVDRVWPRGISKEKASLDEWLKEIGPSSELRKWFNHDKDKFRAFEEKYKEQLNEDDKKREALEQLRKWSKKNETISLIFAAKEVKYNHARVLQLILQDDQNSGEKNNKSNKKSS